MYKENLDESNYNTFHKCNQKKNEYTSITITIKIVRYYTLHWFVAMINKSTNQTILLFQNVIILFT